MSPIFPKHMLEIVREEERVFGYLRDSIGIPKPNEPIHYASLSYCWGVSLAYDERRADKPLSELTLT